MAQTRPRSDRGAIRRWERRNILQLSAGLGAAASLVALDACSPSDPRIDEPSFSPNLNQTADSSPTPDATFAGSTSGAAAEHRAAAIAGGLLARHRSDLTPADRRLYDGIRAAHVQHADVLNSPDPPHRPAPPPPAVNPPPEVNPVRDLSLEQAEALLITTETGLAARHLRSTLGSTGPSALLWGSLSVAAQNSAFALRSQDEVDFLVGLKVHRPVTPLPDIQAIQTMLRQLHAIVYGYQLALGQLPVSSQRHRGAVARLRQHRVLRDRLVEILSKRAAPVPAAAAAYVPSVPPTTAARSAELIKRMEIALQPFAGLWLASAASDSDRRLAWSALSATAAAAAGWRAPLTVWPGWSD